MNIIHYCTLQDNSNYVGRSSGLVCFLCCCSPCRCPLHPPDEVYIHGASWFKRTSRWLTRTLCRYCLCLCHNKYPDPSVLRVQGHFPPFLTGSSQDNCMICWEGNILISDIGQNSPGSVIVPARNRMTFNACVQQTTSWEKTQGGLLSGVPQL